MAKGIRATFTPDWLTFEISEALGKINGKDARRKESAVLRIAEATAKGAPLSSVFGKETCSSNTWYGYTGSDGRRRAAWRDDPAVVEALRLSTERARWWVRVRDGQSVQNALDTLKDGVESAASQLVCIARDGYARAIIKDKDGRDVVQLRHAKVSEIAKAATDILDRVSTMTAPKSSQAHELPKEVMNAIDRVYGKVGSSGSNGGDASGAAK